MNDFQVLREGMSAKNFKNEGICKNLEERLVGTTSSDNSELFQYCNSANVNNSKTDNDSLNEGAKCRNHTRGKKISRPKKHKWKHFHKWDGDERRILGDRIFKRACRNREEISVSGLTLVPYNTTQFIIQDRNYEEPDFEAMYNEGRYLEMLNALQCERAQISREQMKDIIEQYKTEQSQSNDLATDINSLSNKDIIEKIMLMEDKVDELETLLSDSLKEKKPAVNVQEECLKIEVYKDEIKELKLENRFLDYVNEKLENEIEYFCRKLDHSK